MSVQEMNSHLEQFYEIDETTRCTLHARFLEKADNDFPYKFIFSGSLTEGAFLNATYDFYRGQNI